MSDETIVKYFIELPPGISHIEPPIVVRYLNKQAPDGKEIVGPHGTGAIAGILLHRVVNFDDLPDALQKVSIVAYPNGALVAVLKYGTIRIKFGSTCPTGQPLYAKPSGKISLFRYSDQIGYIVAPAFEGYYHAMIDIRG